MNKNLIKVTIILSMLLLTLIPLSASAATTGTCGNNLTWTLDDNGTLTISGNGVMTNWNYPGSDSPWYEDSNIKNIVIEHGVTSIGDNAFVANRSLKSVVIPSSVESIGDSSFSSCFNLSEITISNGVRSIGNSAFWSCHSLTKIEIPDSITHIYGWAFGGCRNLGSITIPDSVTYIGAGAFTCCDNLKGFNVDEENNYYTSINDVLFNKSKTNLVSYPLGKAENNYSIPDGVTTITDYAFNQANITSITIPISITYIGIGAFQQCENLKTIYYNGYKKDWEKISISESYANLTYATIHTLEPSFMISTINNIFLVTPNGLEVGNRVIFVCYNGDKMVYVNPYVYAGETTIPFTTTETYDKVKIMVWENSETCVPLCEAQEVPLN